MGVRCGGWGDAGPAAPGVQWVCVVPGEMEVQQLQVWLEGCRLVVCASGPGDGSCTSWVSESGKQARCTDRHLKVTRGVAAFVT